MNYKCYRCKKQTWWRMSLLCRECYTELEKFARPTEKLVRFFTSETKEHKKDRLD